MSGKREKLSESEASITIGGPGDQARKAGKFVKRVRKVRDKAELHDFQLITYLLHMVELEASDIAAGAPHGR